jgi:hypothetical protein
LAERYLEKRDPAFPRDHAQTGMCNHDPLPSDHGLRR